MELPRELRQLEQMRCERQEWAASHYPFTEQGLLARFNPRIQSPPQTSPAAQADTLKPATVESPSSTPVDPLRHTPPTSHLGVADVSPVDVHGSRHPAAQAPVPATVSDLWKETCRKSSLSLGVGRGRTEVLMDTLGRGRPFRKEQASVPALPASGRGFLLRIAQAQKLQEHTGDVEISW